MQVTPGPAPEAGGWVQLEGVEEKFWDEVREPLMGNGSPLLERTS